MALTAGFSKVCSARSGGLLNIWIGNMSQLTSFTLAGDGTYSAMTLASSAVFFLHEFEQDSAEFRESVSIENGSVAVTSEIEFFLPKLADGVRDAVQALMDESPCGLVCVVEDANGTKWVVGYNEISLKTRPLKLDSDTTGTGKAFQDNSGSTIILKGVSGEKARTYTSTVTV